MRERTDRRRRDALGLGLEIAFKRYCKSQLSSSRDEGENRQEKKSNFAEERSNIFFPSLRREPSASRAEKSSMQSVINKDAGIVGTRQTNARMRSRRA